MHVRRSLVVLGFLVGCDGTENQAPVPASNRTGAVVDAPEAVDPEAPPTDEAVDPEAPPTDEAPSSRREPPRFEPTVTPASVELLVLESYSVYCKLIRCTEGEKTPQWRGLVRTPDAAEFRWCERVEGLPDERAHADLYTDVEVVDGACVIGERSKRWSASSHPIRPLTMQAVGTIPLGVPRSELERRFPDADWKSGPVRVTFGEKNDRALYMEAVLDEVGEQLAIPSLPLVSPEQAAERERTHCGSVGGASAFKEVSDDHDERMKLASTPQFVLEPQCLSGAVLVSIDVDSESRLVATASVAVRASKRNAQLRGTVRRAILAAREG